MVVGARQADPTRFDASVGSKTLHVIAQVGPTDVSKSLDSLKLAYKEDTVDGNPSFTISGSRGPVTVNLKKDGGATFITSIEVMATFATKDKLGLSAANDWNSTNRFSRCSIDAQGQPSLATDIIVAEGVTQETLKTTLNLFMMSTRKFDTEVLAKRGL